VIDLHLHTTASDGYYAPHDVVSKAWHTGLRTIAITDHDTVGGVAEARRSGRDIGVDVIAGIEVTAVNEQRDVHVLGYFVDPSSEDLLRFLSEQRAHRMARVREMARRLGSLGMPIDADALIAPFSAQTDRAIGRPAVARALVAAGYVPTIATAFETLLGPGLPAFVARRGASPETVIGVIHGAGGVASLAHPGLIRRDDLIPRMAGSGLDALEVYHSDHTGEDVARYRALARQYGLAISGGSDFHGDSRHTNALLGTVTLPADEFKALEARAPVR
jgi:predicted metal-dependent phosphoesterase TrpH